MAPSLILLLYHKVSNQRFYLDNRPGMPISPASPLIPQEKEEMGLNPALSREILTDLQLYPNLRGCVFVRHWYDQKNHHFCVLVAPQPDPEISEPPVVDSLFVDDGEKVTTTPSGVSDEKPAAESTNSHTETTAETKTDGTTSSTAIGTTTAQTSEKCSDSRSDTNHIIDMNPSKPYDPTSEVSNRLYADELNKLSADWQEVMRYYDV